MAEPIVGKKVTLRGDHAWAEFSGTVTSVVEGAGGEKILLVDLDVQTISVMAYPGQWRRCR